MDAPDASSGNQHRQPTPTLGPMVYGAIATLMLGVNAMERSEEGRRSTVAESLANRRRQPWLPRMLSGSIPVFLALLLTDPSIAGPFEDGESAFRRKHFAAAMHHWRPLAEQGDPRAQAGVASMYLGGLGVVQDDAEALFWATRAAQQEEAHAQYLLGSMYRDGKGVEKDLVQAITWFARAAHRGYHWAQYSLGLMHFVGEGTPLDYAEAYYWLVRASDAREHEDEQLVATVSFLLEQVAAQLTREQREEAMRRATLAKRPSQ